MRPLILYSTRDCHLCEQAQGVIQSALGVPAPEVDVADDEDLLSRYGVRIPVLRRTDTNAEIGWPFNERDVLALLE